MKTASGNPVRDNKHQAQSSCFDLRFRGESVKSTDDEERNMFGNHGTDERNSCVSEQGRIDGRILSKRRRPGAPRDLSGAKDTVKEQGNLEADEIIMITDTVQCKTCYN